MYEQIPYSKIVTHDHFVSPDTFEADIKALISPQYTSEQIKKSRTKFNETFIVKFHGDFSDFNSIVYTENQFYERQNFEHPLDIRLRSEIVGRSVLFVGYSFSDPNIRYIWYKLNQLVQNIKYETPPKSYFVTYFNNPLQVELFKKRNIETILLNPMDKKGELEKLLEYIISIQMR